MRSRDAAARAVPAGALIVFLATTAYGQDTTSFAEEPQTPAPYSLPFVLRGIIPATTVRAETMLGETSVNGAKASTVLQYLTASYAFIPTASAFARMGFVDYNPPAGSASTAFSNLTLGGLWGVNLPPIFRFGAVGGVILPTGQGQGNTPSAAETAAISAGNLTRFRYEGAAFGSNYLSPFVGADVAVVTGGLTVQVEATLSPLVRVVGSAPTVPDGEQTVLTAGLHIGYFLVPQLSLGVDLHDHSFISSVAAVTANKIPGSVVALAGGPRVHIKLGASVWLHPGIAYSHSFGELTASISAPAYNVVQLDIPIVF
jgi:hypothetical protein